MVSAQSRLTASRGLMKDGAVAVQAGRFTEYRTAGEVSDDDDEGSEGEGKCNDMIRTDSPDKPGEQGFIVFSRKGNPKSVLTLK